MPTVYASEKDCKSPLGKKMHYWRVQRPDEWAMDEFIRDADAQHARIKELEEIARAVAHIGVDWGCGEYAMLPTDPMVGKARKLLEA
jgi:hypothetical protein